MKYTKTVKKLEDKDIKHALVNEGSNLKLTLEQTNKKIISLKDKIYNYKIADNFSELNFELEKYNSDLKNIINKIFILNKEIKNIKDSLGEKINTSVEDVLNLYGDLKNLFHTQLLKNLNDVEKFHNNLLDNRKKRFQNDLIKLNKDKKNFTEKKEKIQNRINELYIILKNSGNLNEYDSIKSELTILEIKKTKIDNYLDAVKTKNDKILETKVLLSKNNEETNKYLENIDEILSSANILFSQMVEELYGEEIAGIISVEINDKESNGLQFYIKTTISISDSSTGINHMKILLFDNVLLNQKKTKIKFLMHDDKIFFGADSKQISSILRHLNNNENNFQYIFSINQNTVNDLKNKYSEEDYKEIIEKNVVLDLDGKGDINKLLGQSVSIKIKE
jgi:uncharacterized protein YydD (DUF2326 family)